MYITVDGTIASSEVEDYKSTVKKNVSMMKSGFTTMMDLTKASVFDQDSMKMYSL